jgi:5'-nucleotidase
LHVVWDGTRRRGDRIVALLGADGEPVDRRETYTVTVNAFIAGGGDGCQELLGGVDRARGSTDVDALVEYVAQLPQPLVASVEGRIRMAR